MYSVLILDDEPWIAEGFSRLVDWEGCGFRPPVALTDAEEGLNYILENRPDVVFSDIRMPGFSGLDILQRLREAEIDCEVILISGFSEFSYAKQAMRYDAFDYLLKPIRKDEVCLLLERLVQKLNEKKRLKQTPFLFADFMPEDAEKQIEQYCAGSTRLIIAEQEIQTDCPKIRIGKERYLHFVPSESEVKLAIPDCSIGISRSSGDYQKKYREADIASCGMFMNGSKETVIYRSFDYSLINSLIEKNVKGFEQKTESEIKQSFAEIQEVFCRENYLIDVAEHFWNHLVARLNFSFDENLDILESMEVQFMTYQQIVQKFSNLQNMFEYLTDVFVAVSKKQERDIDHKAFKGILEYIDNHFGERLYLRDIAAKFYLNPAYCCQLFKKITGETFSDYLVNIRMREAEKLLADKSLSIEEISHRTGYDDYYYFSKVFKKHYSCTPYKYRKMNKGDWK